MRASWSCRTSALALATAFLGCSEDVGPIPAPPPPIAARAPAPIVARNDVTIPPDVVVTLPAGWTELPDRGGPRTFAPRGDDRDGVLQLSNIPDDDYDFIAQHEALAPFASAFGSRLTDWGTPKLAKDVPSTLGRAGMASFRGGAFPASVLWVVVAPGRAYMWTWLGPTADAPEVAIAQRIVATAVEPTRSPSADALAFVAALDRRSTARAPLAAGVEGNLAVLDGTFAAVATARTLVLHTRLYEDPASRLTITLALGETLRLRIERDPLAQASQPARLRAGKMWSLLGEQIAAPYQPLDLDAIVLETGLLHPRSPGRFTSPGAGTWVLLETQPDRMFIAFDVHDGTIELFPKKPREPNAAGVALFKAL